MSDKELLDIIFLLGEGVWKNWGFIITVNLAVVGWLLQRHGLYSFHEKVISTLGYTAFAGIMAFGMNSSYEKLDAAANELAFQHTVITENDKYKYSPNGIVKYYISLSPKYCADAAKKHPDIEECKVYSENVWVAYIALIINWLFLIPLFWYERVWIKARVKAET